MVASGWGGLVFAQFDPDSVDARESTVSPRSFDRYGDHEYEASVFINDFGHQWYVYWFEGELFTQIEIDAFRDSRVNERVEVFGPYFGRDVIGRAIDVYDIVFFEEDGGGRLSYFLMRGSAPSSGLPDPADAPPPGSGPGGNGDDDGVDDDEGAGGGDDEDTMTEDPPAEDDPMDDEEDDDGSEVDPMTECDCDAEDGVVLFENSDGEVVNSCTDEQREECESGECDSCCRTGEVVFECDCSRPQFVMLGFNEVGDLVRNDCTQSQRDNCFASEVNPGDPPALPDAEGAAGLRSLGELGDSVLELSPAVEITQSRPPPLHITFPVIGSTSIPIAPEAGSVMDRVRLGFRAAMLLFFLYALFSATIRRFS